MVEEWNGMGLIPLGAKVHKSASNVNVYFVKAKHKEVSNKKKICITSSNLGTM